MKKTLRIAVATLALASFAATAQAEGDAKKGEKVFKKCKVCHMVGEKAKKRVGPPLNNIIDAKAGVQEGFKYSKSMLAAGEGGLTWSVEKLDEYLTKPKKMIPKGKMSFPGLKKEDDRANVIAYLKTFSE
jgi:cytochrome c